MRIKYFGSAASLSLALFLSACGGQNSSPPAGASTPTESAPASMSPARLALGGLTADTAARLAKQATFGPTPALIDHMVAVGSEEAWIDEQLNLRTSTYADLAAKPVPTSFCQGTTGQESQSCNRDNFQVTPVGMRFYANAISNDDQLRQRVAFALSQIVVASDLEVHTTAGLATFNQILLDGSFGNYRDILKAVTLNPYMGDFLDMADSDKTQPNENYARELMQLFSIGTTLLNADGTPQTDNSGATIAAYSNADVKEVARALTGWTYVRLNGAAVTDNTKRDYSKPLVPYSARFDTGAKSFLGANVQANASQLANVDAVVDALFNHPNIGPYICKRLIQQLIVANPTPAYVGRVAAVFADNGAGTRGDMKAVVRAIYLDSEARVLSQFPGKVKEPVLLATSLARAIGFKSDGYAFLMRDTNMGQQPFRAPSVFNYYPYDFPLPQGAGLVSPVGKLMTTSTVIARHNFIYDFTLGGDATRPEFAAQSGLTGSVGSQPNWAQWEALTADQALDRINLLMLNGTMTAAQRQAISTAMSAYKSSDPALQTRRRVQTAFYVVASSPLFQVDR